MRPVGETGRAGRTLLTGLLLTGGLVLIGTGFPSLAVAGGLACLLAGHEAARLHRSRGEQE
jgi:hypothetical protein